MNPRKNPQINPAKINEEILGEIPENILETIGWNPLSIINPYSSAQVTF